MYSHARVLLETLYHLSAMRLYRPFISFTKDAAGHHPATERHAIACANHAIALTNIIHQDLNELGCLRTWHQTCSDQLSASLSLIGYIVAFPRGPTAIEARKSIHMAMESLDLLAGTFARAARDSAMLQDVLKQVNMLQADARLELPFDWQDNGISPPHTNQSIPDVSCHRSGFQRWENMHSAMPEPYQSADSRASENWLNDLFDFPDMTGNEHLSVALS
jgi:hypothetical protein